MHDDLLEVAARRARAWLAVLAVAGGLGPAIVIAVVADVVAGLVVGAVAAGAGLAWLLAGAPGLRRPAWPVAGLGPAGPEVAGITAGIALATGRAEVRAWEAAHPAPNVGAFRRRSELSLVVTDGARERLTRDQLEAVCAVQLAIADDATCRRLEGGVAFVGVARAVGFAAVASLGLTIPFAPPLAVAGLATVPASAAAWLIGGRVRWWSRVAADAVCVRTTRHPRALVDGLRVLARADGDQVPVGWLTGLLGLGGSQWAVELGPRWTSYVRVNGRLVDQRSAELVEDTRLLVRAALVRRVLLEDADATVASYRELARQVRAAARAAAVGGTAEIEGELVGFSGIVPESPTHPRPGIDEFVPPGWHPDPTGEARLRWWDGMAWTDRTSS